MNNFHGKSIQQILFINFLKDDNIIVVHKTDFILSFFNNLFMVSWTTNSIHMNTSLDTFYNNVMKIYLRDTSGIR